ncbi:hypothetical protein F0562_012669 [Nyssa sinensis]|uniref:Uncharacterized protein n=1 Tax=Nyssa sinensis TaxID=561372 RepID=A0A5J4ZYA0_9ASTE|nr:hypothetical protein F0562_012669 [Nyssa sinensis]
MRLEQQNKSVFVLTMVKLGIRSHDDTLDIISGDKLDERTECPSDEYLDYSNEHQNDTNEHDSQDESSQDQMEVVQPESQPTTSPLHNVPVDQLLLESESMSEPQVQSETQLKILPYRTIRGKPRVNYEPFLTSKSHQKERIVERESRSRGRSRSRSPRPRYRDEYRNRDSRRRSRSRSRDRYDRDRYRGRDKDYHHRSRSLSGSPDHCKDRRRGRYDDERLSRSRSYGSDSPARRSPSPQRSPSPRKTPPRAGTPDGRNRKECSPTPKSVSPHDRPADSQSPSPRNSDVDE